MKKIGLIILSVIGLALSRADAGPTLPDSYYRSSGSRPYYEVFIKNQVIDGVQTTYAAIYQEGESKKKVKAYEYGGLFRLEGLEDGTMVWTLIYQGENNLLTMLTDTPFYQSRLNGNNLVLWATPTGAQYKCPSNLELQKVSGGVQWASTSGQVRLSDAFNRESFFDVSSLQIQTRLGELWAGASEDKSTMTSYYLTSSLVAAQVLRTRAYDSETASGLSYSRKIQGVTISTYDGQKWTLRILEQPVGRIQCWYRGATLK